MIKSITLLGSSSGRNAGDAALMSSIMDNIDAQLGRRVLYEIPTIKPEFVWQSYQNRVRPLGLMPWNMAIKILGLPTYQSVMRTEMTLIFDAVLFDRALYNPLFNFLSTFYLLLPWAKRAGKKLGMYDSGLGPVPTPRGKKMLKSVCELMDFITIRDQGSMRVYEEIAAQNEHVYLTADAALVASAVSVSEAVAILKGQGLDSTRPILAINVNRYINTWSQTGQSAMSKEEFLRVFAAGVKGFLAQQKPEQLDILYVATQYDDIDLTKDLQGMVGFSGRQALISNKEYSHYQLKAILGQCDLLFAMRLHAMILASSMNTPIACLAYQPKCEYHFELLNIQDHCINFNSFSAESIQNTMTQAWAKRMEIKSKITEKMPTLKALANKPAELVKLINDGQALPNN